MKCYLSSYKFGNDIDKLQSMISDNRKIGHIINARDFTAADPARMRVTQAEEIEQLNQLGFEAEAIDLKDYFHQEEALRSKLNTLGGVWVCGGNTFVLRQAMRLSGFDVIIKELSQKSDFLYAGYSAGICVLSKSIRTSRLVDTPTDFPYPEIKETIWEGLGLFDYEFLPHYNSDHPESKDTDKAIQYCIENKVLFKALRDGEIIAMENIS
ncbi:MAG: Type 1 glutamine amidotransferase-like domain-containing protein [Flavisolibacter sp.]